ncbi:MAG: arylsulfatase [Verrucomicrobia bacterium]|nr:arylsulfatase [Verrucomicrobiota bacterium]
MSSARVPNVSGRSFLRSPSEPFPTRRFGPNRPAILAFILIGFFYVIFLPSSFCVPNRPNILLIVSDDLGYSDLGCFGGEIETPNLDRLAEEGVRLTQFYNTGRCCPSRASILTGQYPHRVGLGHMTIDLNRPGYRGRVSEEAQTIAQVLEPAGYRSFIAGKWHLGTKDPTQHGFEEFYGTLVSAKRFFDPSHLLRLPEGRKALSYEEGEFYATDAITDHALDFLSLARETPERPWFLYLAHPAPHFPLHAPKEEIAKYADRYHEGWDKIREERLKKMKALGIVSEETELTPRSPYWNYGETVTGTNPAWADISDPSRREDLARRMAIFAAMVDRMDQQIGRVIEDLKANDEFENTLIIFLSDNGACAEWDWKGFDERSSNINHLHEGFEGLDSMGGSGTFHSVGSGWANSSNTPWRMYKHYNYEGGTNSPGIIHWPARLNSMAGQLHRQPAHVIDLLPTFVAAADISYKGELPLPGEDLLAQIFGEDSSFRTLYFEHESNRAIREGNWKLVALKHEPWELYNMSRVRTEMEDLSGKYKDVVTRLSGKWDDWAEENFVTPLPKDYGVKYLKKRVEGRGARDE